MAYTITETAPTYANAHNDVIFSVYDNVRSNNQTTYPDFTYICDVYVDSVMVARLKAIPDPTYFAGVFNVSSILTCYTADIVLTRPSGGAILGTTNNVRLAYQLKFGSEYGSTLTTNEIVDSSRYVYNSYDKDSWQNGGSALYGASGKYLTDRPQRISVDEDTLFSPIHYLLPSTGTVYGTAGTYNSLGNTIDSATFALIPVSGSPYKSFEINTTKEALLPDLDITNAVGSFISVSGTTYYTDWLCNPKFESYTVAFINKYGVWDAKDFYKASSKNIEIDRKSIGLMHYTTGVSGSVSYQYTGVNNFNNKVSRKIKLRSDWISDAEYIWLEQLIVSPYILVYGLISTQGLRAKLTNTDYEPKQFVKDGLTILELEFEFDGYSPQRL